MSSTKHKTPVRIVCPHCRRTYVINVDLSRIYTTKPRAICSRCGGRFEVVQRMYEVEEEGTTAPPSQAARTRRRKVGERPRQDAPPSSPQGAPSDNASREERPPQEPEEPKPRAAEAPPKSKERRASSEVETVPLFPKGASKPQTKPSPTALEEPSPEPKAQGGEASTTDGSAQRAEKAPSSLSLLWSEISPETNAPGQLRAPSPKDLNTPMPWMDEAPKSLSEIPFQVPERAAVLEWLLTDRPSHPQGASPPPLPDDAKEGDPKEEPSS